MKIVIHLVLLCFGCWSAFAQGNFIVVPNALANTEGNSSTSDPFNSSTFRFQQVYSASQFGSTPFIISKIYFRLDGASTGDVGWSFGGSTIQFSTTSRSPDSLSSVFADNIGSDVTTVRSAALPITGAYQAGASPQPFGQGISMTTAFLYNPAQGNLLLDIRGSGGITVFPGALDGASTDGDAVSWVSSTSTFATSGTASTFGLITEFQVTPIPEPGMWSLILIGFGALAVFRRK